MNNFNQIHWIPFSGIITFLIDPKLNGTVQNVKELIYLLSFGLYHATTIIASGEILMHLY